MKDEKRRKHNYRKLKKAGYNSKEANRYKDMSKQKIAFLISERVAFNKKQESIIGGGNNG